MKNETVIVKGLKKKTDYKKNWNYTHLLAKWHANLFYPALKKKKKPKKKIRSWFLILPFHIMQKEQIQTLKEISQKFVIPAKSATRKSIPLRLFSLKIIIIFFFFKGIHGIWAPSSGTINILKTSHLFICLIVWPTPQNNLTLWHLNPF